MEFVSELNAAVKRGINGFKEFILQHLETNSDFLEQFFWIASGEQKTVLNHLIQEHQETPEGAVVQQVPIDLTEFIAFVIDKASDKNVGEPLHQAIAAGKVRLALHILNNSDSYHFDMNRRDQQGRTLLSLVLGTKNKELLTKILASKANVYAISYVPDAQMPLQPLHEAITMDFAFGVWSLGRAGAQLANPVGTKKDTPLLLAASLGKINALAALLEFPVAQLQIEAENNDVIADTTTGYNAIEALCKLLAHDNNNKKLIRGVALLLCCGAEPPRSKEMCQLLANERSELLKEIDKYLDNKPHLVDPFVNRCHLKGSPLYNIIYVDHSWGSSLRHLLDRLSDAAFIVEGWVTRKYSRPSAKDTDAPLLSTAAAATLTGDEPPFKLYAEFVRRYRQAYDGQGIANPWSRMRWMIAEGRCTWDMVVDYARTHPGSRTQIIYNEMFKTFPVVAVHKELGPTL